MNTTLSGKKIAKIVLIVVAVLAVLLVILSSFTVVPVGHRGVLTTFGAIQTGTLQEGSILRSPLYRTCRMWTFGYARWRPMPVLPARTLQEISSTIAVNYRIDAGAADQLIKNVGTAYESTIISPAIAECVKAVTSQYTAEELITKRTAVSAQMKDDLATKLKDKYILVDSFNIIDFGFSDQFNKAIEEMQLPSKTL